MIDATYGDFLSEVAAGRCMTREAVREVAKGRVWSGSQAVEVGELAERANDTGPKQWAC